jgi:serine/threonine-protein kinase
VEPEELSSHDLPRTFGRYTLFDFVGRGGMAEIYLARVTGELGTARLFVVKEILPEFSENSTFADMLIHEAKLAARLTHANIVTVFDLGRESGRLFITMEYVEGFDLGALLRRLTKRKIPLPLELALTIVTSTLRGLDYAHRRTDDEGRPSGIVHRDVSPSNILVSFGGDVKVCDFGIAHANDAAFAPDASKPLDENAIKGKAGYMSPEQANGQPTLDARADVFAAGIVLWELLAGRKLYKADGDRSQLLSQARRADIPDLPPKGLPQEARLHGIVRKALAKDPAQRYASAQEMLKDLEGYAIETGQLASSIKLGDWLVETFGEEVLQQRRIRERAAAALQRGPLVQLTPIEQTPAPPVFPAPAPAAPSAEAIARHEALTRLAATPEPPPPKSPRALSVAPPPSIDGTTISLGPEESSSRGPFPPDSLASPPRNRSMLIAALALAIVLIAVLVVRALH